MARNLTIDNNTRLQQARASNPGNSAWVSANAGSGKTFVLSRRVVRLLLAGTDPSRILCLTFTKAAAGEMSNRVFDILGGWTSLNDDDLRKELLEIEGQMPDPLQMQRARTLFARALETPGGLKIQTIHAFCEAILHQFPLEANIPGNFSGMEDGQQKRLMALAYRQVVLEADDHPENPLGKAFTRIMEVAGDAAIEKVISEIISKRDELTNWLAENGGPAGATDRAKSHFGFSESDSCSALTSALVSNSAFNAIDCAGLADTLHEVGETGATTIAEHLHGFANATTHEGKLDHITPLILTASGEPRKFGRYPSKAVVAIAPTLRETMESEVGRILEGRSRINLLSIIEATNPLMVVGEAMLANYHRMKRVRGLLDFDDLVSRTADLLSRSDARSWVLYKLDLGIDHILLDEAQDTSPRQWQVISSLVDEFFSGESARPANRTVFAVGDEKQSIYSFQGAAPESFVSQKRHYGTQAKTARKAFDDVNLGLSFRSTTDVLSAVDAVFSIPQNAKGLTFDGQSPPHTSARRNDPGCVDVWDLIRADNKPIETDWQTPIDVTTNTHQSVQLAEKIADQLKLWIGNERLEASGKLIEASDVLVLVRARDQFVTALNRALKNKNIPVAGADRLAITDHIAVMDLVALGQVMLTPEDDLSLACVLKSPLIGLTEDELYTLSRSRLHEKYETSLFEALRAADDDRSKHAYELLINWRSRVDELPVYEFYARILGADEGRLKFYNRLGLEAEDVLDAFLTQTLSFEQSGLPGLQAFLTQLRDENPIIKRELDKASGEVRVMTVHAAKGLEAPIVFLVDKCSPAFQGQKAPALYQWGDEQVHGYFWTPSASHHSQETQALRDKERQKTEEEYRRLLYVGMTRAEDRLIICGYGSKSIPQPNWHGMVSMALEPDWQDICDGDGNLLWHRWKAKDSPQAAPWHHAGEDRPIDKQRSALPNWIRHRLPAETALPRPLNPSGAQAVIDDQLTEPLKIPSLLGDTNIVDGDNVNPNPRKRGTVLHTLLQMLPDLGPVHRWQIAEDYLARTLPENNEWQRERLLQGLQSTIENPELAPCFDSTHSRGEVPVMGEIMLTTGKRALSGIIDRLAVLDDRAIILDYKTSTFVPQNSNDIPHDYLTQMALYGDIIARIYPNKRVEAFLIWTHARDEPKVVKLTATTLDQALNALGKSDSK